MSARTYRLKDNCDRFVGSRVNMSSPIAMYRALSVLETMLSAE